MDETPGCGPAGAPGSMGAPGTTGPAGAAGPATLHVREVVIDCASHDAVVAFWAAALGWRPRRVNVLYDRDCGFCVASARRLARWDRNGSLELLALQDAVASGREPPVRVAAELPLRERLHVVDEVTGEVAAGGEAALAILDRLPGGIVFRPFARLPHVRWGAARAYDLVARNRDRIATLLRLDASCEVPPG